CLAIGADDFISKPVDKLELRARVQAMLRISHQHQQLEHTLEQLKSAQAHILQSEKMSALGRLVAGIAHEVNNPITFISGNIEYIEESVNGLVETIYSYQQKPPEVGYELYQKLQSLKLQSLDFEFLKKDLPKAFRSIKVGVERIEEIVSNLVMFAHLNESGQKYIDIHKSLENILFLLDNRLTLNSQALPIQLVKSYGDIPLVYGYPDLLNQALMNILSNAIDAFELDLCSSVEQQYPQDILAQSRQIALKTTLVDNRWVRIEIADNGFGMTPETKSHIFDPFFTTKSVGEGIGMGLSISYQIITEGHGGTLECFSTQNKGSEFIIHLPIPVS
ncbi:MAG: histidine kinase, partial [Leptolyngbya sp. SIO3F4]|nr:histidine kinase [Leptolyngbya sp. SIO3F4]